MGLGQSRHLLPHRPVPGVLPGQAVQRLRPRPPGAPPVLELVAALVPGGYDEPRLFVLRITEKLAPLQDPAKDGLGGVLRVGHVFHQHQANLVDHLKVPLI